MDRRLTPFSGRVAHVSLQGQVAADAFVPGEPARIVQPVVDLDARPAGPRDRQVLWGEKVTVIDRQDGRAFVQAAKDRYCGWLPEAALGPDHSVTHRVTARFTQLYPAPDIKTRETATLPFAAQVEVQEQSGRFARTPHGWLPLDHLRAVDAHDTDPVAVALGFLGSPYLWGGNSAAGLDCSGLAQAALLACGLDCPGDSDLQAALGRELGPDEALRPGDLVFWKGHVALAIDATDIVHATAAFMAVVREPLSVALARIAATGGGPVTHRRRVFGQG